MEKQEEKKIKPEVKAFLDWQESKEYQKKLEERLKTQQACEKSMEAKAITFEVCREDPLFFIENFLWTFDPREGIKNHHLPFFLFPFQKDYLLWLLSRIEAGEDGLVEKTRDMGATWVTLALIFWLWRFRESFSACVGSRKEEFVDNKTSKSLLGILDYFMDGLPQWLRPHRYSKHSYRQHLKLTNPENKNLIFGESANRDFSRGARSTLVFFDEFAFWDYAEDAWSAAGDTSRTRIAVSTPNGDTKFKRLRFSGRTPVKTLHWKENPLKTEKWYRQEQLRRSDEEMAREIDISYEKSITGRVYPEWDFVPFGKYEYNDSAPLYVGWDFGLSDSTGIIWCQKDEQSGRWAIIDCCWNHEKTIDFYIPFVTGYVSSDTIYRYSKKDMEVVEAHRGWQRGIHFGDPAGKNRNQVTNTGVLEELLKFGVRVNTDARKREWEIRKNETKIFMKNLAVADNERNRYLDECIKNSRYPAVSRDGLREARTNVKPIHNWASHLRSALEYLAVNISSHREGRRARVIDTIVAGYSNPLAQVRY